MHPCISWWKFLRKFFLEHYSFNHTQFFIENSITTIHSNNNSSKVRRLRFVESFTVHARPLSGYWHHKLQHRQSLVKVRVLGKVCFTSCTFLHITFWQRPRRTSYLWVSCLLVSCLLLFSSPFPLVLILVF